MELYLSFNGAQTNLTTIQPVVEAAAEHSAISMNTANSWLQAELITLVQAAGFKNFSLDFNAAQSDLTLVKSVLAAASASTSINMNTAQAWSSSDLVSLVESASAKNLTLSFNPAQSNLALLQTVISAAPPETIFELDTLQAWSANDLVTLVQSAGTKKFSLDFNGAQSNLALIQPVITAAQANTKISLNSAQSWSMNDLTDLETAAGTKNLGLDFNGAQANLSLIQSVLEAALANTNLALNTAQSWSSSDLVTLANIAGAKNLALAFNAAQSNLPLLQSVVGAARSNTAVSMNTAQSWVLDDLTSLTRSAGEKLFSLAFNGAQSAAPLVSAVIALSGSNTGVSVNSAQTIAIDDLVSWVTAAE